MKHSLAETNEDSCQKRPKADWFENVENLRPLREGRRAGTLGAMSEGKPRITVREAEDKFNLEFEKALKMGPEEDGLAVLLEFVRWFEENFLSGRRHIFYPILYKICTTFCNQPRYLNDERMLKLWIKLAEAFPESGLAVMQFAFTRGSCRQLAKFYIRWSETYQSIGGWNRAREKLELGIAMCAMPLPLLHEARNELEAQAMRAMKSSAAGDIEADSPADTSSAGEERRVLGELRALGRMREAPIVRHMQGPPGRIYNSGKKSSSKPRLDQFEVFVDEQPPSKKNNLICAAFRSTVAQEFKDDPDYQALFGFFADTKIHMQLTNTENQSKRRLVMTDCALTLHSQRESLRADVRDPEFEVFNDKADSHTCQLGNPKKVAEAKLMLKASLLSTSAEEEYAILIASKCT